MNGLMTQGVPQGGQWMQHGGHHQGGVLPMSEGGNLPSQAHGGMFGAGGTAPGATQHGGQSSGAWSWFGGRQSGGDHRELQAFAVEAAPASATTGTHGGHAAEAGCAGIMSECHNLGGMPRYVEVGEDNGDYVLESSYKYVGHGHGNVELVPFPRFRKYAPHCFFVTVVLIAAAIVWGFSSEQTLILKAMPGTEAREEASSASAAAAAAAAAASAVAAIMAHPHNGTQQASFADCEWDAEAQWTLSRREYCCHTYGFGCRASQLQPLVQVETTTTTACLNPPCDAWVVTTPPPPSSPPPPTTTTPPPPPTVGTCKLWGDPHIVGFDGGNTADFFDEGVVWIVKSPQVSVQALYKATQYTNGNAATHSIAVGGAFLKGHTLKVGPQVGGVISWDGRSILQSPGSVYNTELGNIVYTQRDDLIDADMKRWSTDPPVAVDAQFPDGFSIEVFRWDNHINVRIKMRRVEGIDGHCGTFNGNPADDTPEAIVGRLGRSVDMSNSLFINSYLPFKAGSSETVEDCEWSTRQAAEATCREKNVAASVLDACIFDLCFARNRYAAQDAIFHS